MSSSPVNTGEILTAVLFDMDGTLVDTEPYWIAAEYRLVEEFGGVWTDEHAHNLVGNALIASAEYLRDVGGVRMDPPAIVERLLDEVIEAALEHMPWRPGAVELLDEIRAAGVPCALVTMSYASLADTLVAQLPPDTFAAVVTGDQVIDGKPHPEAYLTAAERLGVAPETCVAIEDSPTGLASAEAAGCVAVAIPHHLPIDARPGRTVVGDMHGLRLDDLRRLVADRNGTPAAG